MPKKSPEELQKLVDEWVDRNKSRWEELTDDMRAEGWSEQRILELSHRVHQRLIDHIRALKPQ